LAELICGASAFPSLRKGLGSPPSPAAQKDVAMWQLCHQQDDRPERLDPPPSCRLAAQWRRSQSRREAIRMLTALLATSQRGAALEHDVKGVQDVAGPSTVVGGVPIADEEEHTGGHNKIWDGYSADVTPQTTIMAQNIPGDVTVAHLLQVWPLDGSYDLLYLPRTGGGRRAVVYAFINFVSESRAKEFCARWNGQRLPQCDSARRMKLRLARVQGFDANVHLLRKQRGPMSAGASCRSGLVLLRDGQEVSLDDA